MKNTFNLIGYLGKDPIEHKTEAGRKYAIVDIAVNEYRKINEEVVKHVSWFTVFYFGSSAERVLKSLKKGEYVMIDGKMQIRDSKLMLKGFKYIKL